MSSAADLADDLGLEDCRLRAALLAVPRENFVPDVGLACPVSGASFPIDRHTRPEEWRRAVFTDAAIITQWEDEQTDPARVDVRRAVASSSISAPRVAFAFLDLLFPRPGDRIMEIGTGTGYTAAVLAACAGGESVTSIEVDPDVAAQAQENLNRSGYSPRVVVGDGAEGWPAGAPYDRVHATCAVRRIPAAWIAQTRPGGTIVVPWQPDHDWGWMVQLRVSSTAAHGRFHGRSGYMMLRNQRVPMRFHTHHEDQAAEDATSMDPRSVADAPEGAQLVIAALAPGVKPIAHHTDGGGVAVSLYELEASEGSWAECEYEPGRDQFQTTQYGPRRLWDEVEGAFLHWLNLGSPGIERFGLTVTSQGDHRIWLDTPDRLLGSE